MKKMRKTTIFLLLLFIIVFSTKAQITTEEEPISFSLSELNNLKLTENFISFDKEKLPDISVIENEDKVDDVDVEKPIRFAFPIQVNYNLQNSGQWIDLPNGDKLWTLNLHFSGALSLHALYDRFWLPEGAKFFVYSNETKQKIGAITSEFLEGCFEDASPFSTGIIYGEYITFEYYQPSNVKDEAIISISRIDYSYRFINSPY